MDTDNAPAETPAGTGTVDEAAAKFERLLAGDGNQQTEAVDEADAAPDEGEGSDEAEETPSEEEDEAEDEADAPEEDAEEEKEDEEDKLYTVKVDGQEMQVPLDELLKGYSRTSDYTRKTTALAEERKAFQAEAEQVRTERAQYAQLLPILAQQIQSAMPKPPDTTLIEQDPQEYLRQRARFEADSEKLRAATEEMQRVQQLQAQEQAAQLEAIIAEGRNRLFEAVPEWRDQRVYERERVELREFAKSIGYSEEELNQAYDYRMILALRLAKKGKDLLSKQFKPNKPAPPKVTRAPAPPPPTKVPARQRQFQEARKRLARTGSLRDAAAAFEKLI